DLGPAAPRPCSGVAPAAGRPGCGAEPARRCSCDPGAVVQRGRAGDGLAAHDAALEVRAEARVAGGLGPDRCLDAAPDTRVQRPGATVVGRTALVPDHGLVRV